MSSTFFFVFFWLVDRVLITVLESIVLKFIRRLGGTMQQKRIDFQVTHVERIELVIYTMRWPLPFFLEHIW